MTQLGLHISDVSLKLIQFDRQGEKYVVEGYSEAQIPQNPASPEKVTNGKQLAELIKQSIRSPKFGKITTPYVIASIPETKSFVRVIRMTRMSEQEAVEAVPWEAEAYIPLPIGQVYLDWVILNKDKGLSADNKMTVLISAAPKDYVDELIGVLKAASLKPIALEVESQATARSLVQKMDEAVLIADINTFRTSLIIYNKGILEFTSSLPIAGNSFTEGIAKGLTLDFEQAEKLKRLHGLDELPEKGRIRKALISVLNGLVEEIKNTIRFHEEHSAENALISRLLLTGGASKLRHLPSFLQTVLRRTSSVEHALRSLPDIKVELGNPWVKVLKKGQVPLLSREDSLSYATAIGLALREAE